MNYEIKPAMGLEPIKEVLERISDSSSLNKSETSEINCKLDKIIDLLEKIANK